MHRPGTRPQPVPLTDNLPSLARFLSKFLLRQLPFREMIPARKRFVSFLEALRSTSFPEYLSNLREYSNRVDVLADLIHTVVASALPVSRVDLVDLDARIDDLLYYLGGLGRDRTYFQSSVNTARLKSGRLKPQPPPLYDQLFTRDTLCSLRELVTAYPGCTFSSGQIIVPLPSVTLYDENDDEVELGPFNLHISLTTETTENGPTAWLDYHIYGGEGASLYQDANCHPHVNIDGILCAGAASELIEDACRAFQFADLVTHVQAVLADYNPDSPYVYLKRWNSDPEVECTCCGSARPEDDIYYTSHDNAVCDDCRQICAGCRNYTTHPEERPRYQMPYRYWDDPLFLFCRNCIESGDWDRCWECGHVVHTDDVINHNDLLYCPNCAPSDPDPEDEDDFAEDTELEDIQLLHPPASPEEPARPVSPIEALTHTDFQVATDQTPPHPETPPLPPLVNWQAALSPATITMSDAEVASLRHQVAALRRPLDFPPPPANT